MDDSDVVHFARLTLPAEAEQTGGLPVAERNHPGSPSTRFDPSAPVPEEYDVFCHACGYSLIGLTGERCPECGRPFEPGELPYARVPWLHRRRIGCWPAYWGTVRQVVWRPRAFAEELCRPVRISADDAKRFRRLTVYVAATSIVTAVIVVTWLNGALAVMWRTWRDAAGFMLLAAWGWVAAIVFLRLATDMPLFIWKGLPSLPAIELAPLHHYAAAPLAYAPLVSAVALGLPALAAYANAPPWAQQLSLGLGVLAVAGWLFVCWLTPLVLMRAATGCGRRRVALLAAYLPLHALIMLTLVWLMSLALTLPIVWVVETFDPFF